MSVTPTVPVSERLEALLAEAGLLLAEAVDRRSALETALSVTTLQEKNGFLALDLLTQAVEVVKTAHLQVPENTTGWTTQPYEGYKLAVTRLDGVDVWMHEYDRPDSPEKVVVFSIWPLEFLKSDDQYRLPSFVYDKAHSRFWAGIINGRAPEVAVLQALKKHGLLPKRYAKDKQDVKDPVFSGQVEVHYPWPNQSGIGCLEKIMTAYDTYGVPGIHGVLDLAAADHGTLVDLTGEAWKKYEERWANRRKIELFSKAMHDSPEGLTINGLNEWIDVIHVESRARSFMTLAMPEAQEKMAQRLSLITQYRTLRETQEKAGIAPF